ncbi:MAG: hypothetical protein ACKV1O_04710 [Saprospiraceae bacterium]
MSVDAQKLELITWINSLDDKRLLDQLYVQVKKTMESRQTYDSSASSVSGEKATSESPQPAPGSPLQLLEQITDAYVALDEPDLNATQIFRDRMKASL